MIDSNGFDVSPGFIMSRKTMIDLGGKVVADLILKAL
jgi:hypothetical protein